MIGDNAFDPATCCQKGVMAETGWQLTTAPPQFAPVWHGELGWIRSMLCRTFIGMISECRNVAEARATPPTGGATEGRDRRPNATLRLSPRRVRFENEVIT